MEFMKKFRIQSDCKISISVHHCCKVRTNAAILAVLLLDLAVFFSVGWNCFNLAAS